MISVVNKTFGFVTEAKSEISPTSTVIYTVPNGANFLLKTVKIVDLGGTGGEIRLNAGDFCFESVTIGGYDCVDCSPLTPYAFEGETEISYQNNGGADIHVVLTGILQGFGNGGA